MTSDDLGALKASLSILVEDHWVQVDDHDGTFLGTRREKALLEQLKAAVAGGTSRGSGGSAAKNARSPLNVGAADLLNDILWNGRQEYNWAIRRLGGEARKDAYSAAAFLAGWVSTLDALDRMGALEPTELPRAKARLDNVAGAIRDLLDPPFRFDLTTPCPTCKGSRTADNALALVVTERIPADNSQVDCRLCKASWKGVHEARLLSIAVNEPLTVN